MIKLKVNEFNVFVRILEDEVERHKLWLENKDFISSEESRLLQEEFEELSLMLEEMKIKKERLLTLLR